MHAHAHCQAPENGAEALTMLSHVAGRLLRAYLFEVVTGASRGDAASMEQQDEGQESGQSASGGHVAPKAVGDAQEGQVTGAARMGEQDKEDAKLLRAVEAVGDWGKAYLGHLDPGCHLCYAVWCGIDAMEKARRYSDCVPLLRLILATPFLQHRRGRIFNRLALDLQHLAKETGTASLHAEALAVCDQALKDVYVSGGDRLTLLKRRQRLVAVVEKAGSADAADAAAVAKASAMKMSKGAGLLEECLSDSISSDDFQDSERGAGERGARGVKVKAKLSKTKLGKGGARKRAVGDGSERVSSPPLVEQIGNEELVLLGIVSEDTLRATTDGDLHSTDDDASGHGARAQEPGRGGHFMSALQREWAEWPDDVIEGTRLGEKTVGRKSRFAGFDLDETRWAEGTDGQTCGVEMLCLQHYAQPANGAWYGLHCEGACFRTLFGILFWDIIFSSEVPDVFLTPFQDAPLDLNTFPDFFVNRKQAILAKLEELKGASPEQLLALVALGWRYVCVYICIFPSMYVCMYV